MVGGGGGAGRIMHDLLLPIFSLRIYSGELNVCWLDNKI